ncbi:hypothetical protein CDAR_255481 [Caerostris darwini]|uniref:Uncharacterized protein n=1 Tax=Caerostris darwini TaxID=1538125 RepID=A0AAV4NQY4_9ARAC|nr:hypothetical protein CDAR_255481 [Caerostris darwini]
MSISSQIHLLFFSSAWIGFRPTSKTSAAELSDKFAFFFLHLKKSEEADVRIRPWGQVHGRTQLAVSLPRASPHLTIDERQLACRPRSHIWQEIFQFYRGHANINKGEKGSQLWHAYYRTAKVPFCMVDQAEI